jgi:hypothetical protein
MALTRRIYPTRFGQLHLRSNAGKGVPLVMLHPSPRSGEMWEGHPFAVLFGLRMSQGFE